MKRIRALTILVTALALILITGTVASFADAKNPVRSGDKTTWNCIWFGSYPQSSNGSPAVDLESGYNVDHVKWRVLSVNGNTALLISDQILDAVKFYDGKESLKTVSYKDSTAFSYLNNEMKNKLFSAEEQAALLVVDTDTSSQLMLPSEAIMMSSSYGFSASKEGSATRKAKVTDFVYDYRGVRKKIGKYKTGLFEYWLSNTWEYKASAVDSGGTIRTQYYNNVNFFGLRPVISIDLSKKVWCDAGTVSSEGDVSEVPFNIPKEITPAVKLSKTEFKWNNKVQKPAVTVMDGSEILDPSQYNVVYQGDCKAIGTYRVDVTLKDKYIGSGTASFEIVPKGTSLSSAKSAKKVMTLKWKKTTAKMPKKQITGYQIQYSLKKDFKSGNKTVNVKGAKKNSIKIKKLKKGKTYYFRIRTYMKSGRTYYSAWSKTKKAKVK